jgi:hypothetical protein
VTKRNRRAQTSIAPAEGAETYSTAEAAFVLGATVRNLQRFRTVGIGPKFSRDVRGVPRYRAVDVFEWLAQEQEQTQTR